MSSNFFEVNLTPVEQKRWRRKVALYLHATLGFQKRVGADAFQVVTFIASPVTVLRRATGTYSKEEQEEREKALRDAEKRKDDFLRWTEAELKTQNREEDGANWFVFSSLPLDTLTPSDLLFAKHFAMPFENEADSLIAEE